MRAACRRDGTAWSGRGTPGLSSRGLGPVRVGPGQADALAGAFGALEADLERCALQRAEAMRREVDASMRTMEAAFRDWDMATPILLGGGYGTTPFP